MALTKVIGTDLIALANVAAGAVSVGSSLDVSTYYAGRLYVRFARRAATALTVPAIIRVEASFGATGTDKWVPVDQFTSDTLAAESEAVTGGTSTVPTVASTTNLLVGGLIYFDNGTPANSEWARIKLVTTNTSITLEEALTNSQSSSTIYTKALEWSRTVDLLQVNRLRAIVDNSGTGQNVAAQVVISGVTAL